LHTITNDSENEFYSHPANQKQDAIKLVTEIPNSDRDDNAYFYWNFLTLRFERLSRAERAAFTDTLVWVPDTSLTYNYYGLNYLDADQCANNFYTLLENKLNQ